MAPPYYCGACKVQWNYRRMIHLVLGLFKLCALAGASYWTGKSLPGIFSMESQNNQSGFMTLMIFGLVLRGLRSGRYILYKDYEPIDKPIEDE